MLAAPQKYIPPHLRNAVAAGIPVGPPPTGPPMIPPPGPYSIPPPQLGGPPPGPQAVHGKLVFYVFAFYFYL